ncbi:pyridoxamine 5'-phosphate oxidase family protein [Nocardia sp. NPDC060256]|uniref:pyridoxamine 5'-phosphate oxidase family protein n=1 Tax=unclassified Nocardia TaxID=2637762 RepID=UPI003646D654
MCCTRSGICCSTTRAAPSAEPPGRSSKSCSPAWIRTACCGCCTAATTTTSPNGRPNCSPRWSCPNPGRTPWVRRSAGSCSWIEL